MQKLIANIRLRKSPMDILLENFEGFLYIAIDMKHRKDAFFTQSLLCTCMDSSDSIIPNPDVIDNNGFALCDNMRDLVLLKNQINRQCN